MRKRLIIAVLLLLSLVPVLYCEQSISAGMEQADNNVVIAVSPPESQNIPTDSKDVLTSESETQPIAVAGEKSGPEPVHASAPAAAQTEIQPQSTVAKVKPVATKTAVKAPVSVGSFSGDAQQSEMLKYINAVRTQAGLDPLILSRNLCDGARMKSKDMAVNGYFSHYSPNYGSPFEMMTSLGIRYGTAGENLAKNFSVEAAHEAFMNSAGHKANILNPEFKKVGLGFYQDNKYLFVTQWFTD